MIFIREQLEKLRILLTQSVLKDTGSITSLVAILGLLGIFVGVTGSFGVWWALSITGFLFFLSALIAAMRG